MALGRLLFLWFACAVISVNADCSTWEVEDYPTLVSTLGTCLEDCNARYPTVPDCCTCYQTFQDAVVAEGCHQPSGEYSNAAYMETVKDSCVDPCTPLHDTVVSCTAECGDDETACCECYETFSTAVIAEGCEGRAWYQDALNDCGRNIATCACSADDCMIDFKKCLIDEWTVRDLYVPPRTCLEVQGDLPKVHGCIVESSCCDELGTITSMIKSFPEVNSFPDLSNCKITQPEQCVSSASKFTGSALTLLVAIVAAAGFLM